MQEPSGLETPPCYKNAEYIANYSLESKHKAKLTMNLNTYNIYRLTK